MTGAKRWWLFWLVPSAIVIAAGLATLLRYQGILVPVRIASGSMAERLLGPHQLVNCADCGFAFRCGLDTETPLQLATCPNCGFERNDLALAASHEGDRVLIDRWAYVRRTPRRGDVVAFIDPANGSELAVKRVMGLPKEAITIRRGELLVNGGLHRKSLAEMKQLATLVYDDAYRPMGEHEMPSRWKGDDDATGWQATRNGYHWTPTHAEAAANDWLMYRHWRCYTSPHPRAEESPVTDNDAYNQGLSRELHEITDVLLSCHVSLAENGEAALLVHDGRERFTAVISTKSRVLNLHRGEDVWERAVLPNHLDPRHVTIEFGVIDDQLLIAIAGETVIRREYVPLDSPLQPTSRPLGISGRQGECSVAKIKVYRDIFYLNPFRTDWAWAGPAPLGDDAYLVLGDNSPLSNDSRHWPEPGLHRQLLIGKVLTPR